MQTCNVEKFDYFTPNEMEFNAECEEVEIVPNFSSPIMNLIEGSFGPFRPSIQKTVPLWLAVFLKRRQRCTVVVPEWMVKEKLEEVLEREREDEQGFQPLPYHYFEMSELLFKEAKDDVVDLHLVREKLKDISSVRRNKLQVGLRKITASDPVEIANLCSVEIEFIRGFMRSALERFRRHDVAGEAAQARAAEAAQAAAAHARAGAQAKQA
mmetsp:Transcript_31425/g.43604  ORF Transcript_31425/g.43604 Transcript_31425/m.43604 type:complete len:211 (+) Transcript_31425:307-939(+)